MPLVNPWRLLQQARLERFAIGAFNIDNLALIAPIVRAATAESSPVIIEIGPAAMAAAGLDETAAVARIAAGKVNVPVGLHLDHGHDLDQIAACIAAGFTSLMIDGSSLPYEQNVRITKAAARLCHRHGLMLEAELGAIPGTEEGHVVKDVEARYTDPEQAADFVARTDCDLLAVSIGNVHYMSRTMLELDFERLVELRTTVPVPLVLHGGAAVTTDTMRRAVTEGISKYNIAYKVHRRFLDGLAAGLAEMNEEEMPGRLVVYPRKVIARAQQEAQDQVQNMMRVLDSSGRADSDGYTGDGGAGDSSGGAAGELT